MAGSGSWSRSQPIVWAPRADSGTALVRLATAYVVGLAASVASIWVVGSYLRGDPFSNISYNGVDAIVVFPPASIGLHTFGDLWLVYMWASEANPWAGAPLPNNYPPLAMFLVEPLSVLSYGRAMAVALSGIAASIIGVTWWGFRRHSARHQIVAIALVLTTAPAISVLDRANTIGLTIVPLFILCLAWTRSRTMLAGVCLALVASIKIYPALLAMPMLATRRWLAVLVGGALTVAWGAMIWLWYPGPGLSEFSQMRAGMFAFLTGPQSLTLQWNYSFAAGLAVLTEKLGLPNPLAGFSPWLPGLVLLAALTFVLALRPRLSVVMLTLAMAVPALAVPISARYATVFALVGIALLGLSASGYPKLPLAVEGPLRSVRVSVFLGAMVVTLVPLTYPLGDLQLPQILIAGGWATLMAIEALSLVIALVGRRQVKESDQAGR